LYIYRNHGDNMATKECVFDGSTTELNTVMNIKLDSGKEVEVYVCDGCADTATLRSIKQAYVEGHAEEIAKDKEIQAFMDQAKKLGLEVVDPRAPKPVAPTPAPTESPAEKEKSVAVRKGSVVVDSKEADRSTIAPKIIGTSGHSPYGGVGSGTGQEYNISSGDKPSEDLRDGEVAEVAIVEGRLGSPVKIPVSRTGKMGTTKINIRNNMTDQQLQSRFKNLAKESIDGHVTAYKDGYDVKFALCTLCHGDGAVRGQECPKCGGVGEIQVNTI
jgi:hypothetical protein